VVGDGGLKDGASRKQTACVFGSAKARSNVRCQNVVVGSSL